MGPYVWEVAYTGVIFLVEGFRIRGPWELPGVYIHAPTQLELHWTLL